MSGSDRLLAELRAGGGALAELADAQARLSRPPAAGPAQIAAAGPRTAGHEEDYEVLLEMILEGSRLHYGIPALVRTDDPDLALLLGDQLYALGLTRLAALGDLPAVSELADVISIVAQAHAEVDDVLADAMWRAGAIAIGWGASPAHERAKELARAGAPDAVAALGEAARARQRGGS